ncbi:hypothetical protein MPTK1_6g13010 [Marchantia polymorpha subsp. ruderalis]|uniref:Uncharacterized protein n=2 Tax=Marchantia polymorpha TaxID=3197 RepID=A0AAF6BRI2_MARPO|nr:hypothetical protein MARPO_0059s0048 [Marchantia polymorpha]BBN14616.1 hypothetical protein Mp_6g13010 [Marchantia polymorpha subsp. ruderalis]|eukprot:PTQ37106.1 hypothetical protein MARPO_0059s0048 [Marchantia polymorpha]
MSPIQGNTRKKSAAARAQISSQIPQRLFYEQGGISMEYCVPPSTRTLRARPETLSRLTKTHALKNQFAAYQDLNLLPLSASKPENDELPLQTGWSEGKRKVR